MGSGKPTLMKLRKSNKQNALERVRYLFKQAEEHPEQARRYVELARKLAMKARLRMPQDLKRRYCKHCYSFLVPGKNCRVRTANRYITYTCLECRRYMRFPKNINKTKQQKKA